LAHGQRDAFARAVRRIDWRPGDVAAVVDDPELSQLAAALPPTVRHVDLDPDGTLPGAVRLVALPIVASASGRRLPVEAIAARAHEAGAAVLAEATLAVGAVPVDPAALGADLLVARASAWLLGPEGLAVVAGEGIDGAVGGLHLPSVAGLARACGWLSMYVGLPWIHARGEALARQLADRLEAIDGVEVLTPPERATVLVFTVRAWQADEALDELGRRIFLLAAAVPAGDAIRVGIGWWNTEDEIDRLADGLELLAAHTPETLPRRPRLAMLGES
jgi:selenocysteine lyase/cysteine desulfurase